MSQARKEGGDAVASSAQKHERRLICFWHHPQIHTLEHACLLFISSLPFFFVLFYFLPIRYDFGSVLFLFHRLVSPATQRHVSCQPNDGSSLCHVSADTANSQPSTKCKLFLILQTRRSASQTPAWCGFERWSAACRPGSGSRSASAAGRMTIGAPFLTW